MYGMVEQLGHKSEIGNLHLPGTPEENYRAPFGKMEIQLLIINPLNSEQAGRHTRVFFFLKLGGAGLPVCGTENKELPVPRIEVDENSICPP